MKLLDLTGKRFGRWSVLKRCGRSHGHTAWLCRCVCGTEKTVSGQDLRRGTSQSCGCLRAEQHYLPKGEAAFNGFLDNTRRGAKNRGYVWNLSKTQVKDLSQGNCYYCGCPPSTVFHYRGNGDYYYNGIDRVDNDQGYTPENCVSCCKICNHAKNTMTTKEFKSWITRVYQHLNNETKSYI